MSKFRVMVCLILLILAVIFMVNVLTHAGQFNISRFDFRFGSFALGVASGLLWVGIIALLGQIDETKKGNINE